MSDQYLVTIYQALTEDTFLSITSMTGNGLMATSVNDQLILSYGIAIKLIYHPLDTFWGVCTIRVF